MENTSNYLKFKPLIGILQMVTLISLFASENLVAGENKIPQDEACIKNAKDIFPNDEARRIQMIKLCLESKENALDVASDNDIRRDQHVKPEDHTKRNERIWYIEFGLFPEGDIGFTTSGSTYDDSSVKYKDTSKFGFQFGIGSQVEKRLLVGFDISSFVLDKEANVATTNGSSVKLKSSLSAQSYGVAATYFPWINGLYFQGGGGLARASLDVSASYFGLSESVKDTYSGYGFKAGVGYLWEVLQQFSIGVNFSYVDQFYSGKILDTDLTLRNIDWWMIGAAFHWEFVSNKI